MKSRVVFYLTILFLWGCGAGPYGHAREYKPLKEEKTFYNNSEELPFKTVVSHPDKFQDKQISWFGVIKSFEKTPQGTYKLILSHRTHQKRHLCEGETRSSCRVTVHFKSSGDFSAEIEVSKKDLGTGFKRIQPGSLLHVYGKVQCVQNDDEQTECKTDDQGNLFLDVEWYRHWPSYSREYVTTRAADIMRR